MEQNESVQNPLGVAPVGKLLRKFAIPGVISMIVHSLYNMVDQIFIGQGVGMLGNGATNIIAPIATIAIAISTLFGDGLSTYFSLHLGKGEPKKASKAVGTAIISGIVVGIVLTAVVLALLKPLCTLFGASKDILPYALDYGFIIALGFPFVVVSTIINSAIKCDGSPRFSMVSMIIGTVLNVILDPLFIFPLKMGVKGAALATIISQAVSCGVNVIYLFRFKTIPFSKESFHFSIRLAGRMATFGVSSCINTLTSTIIGLISNNLFLHYGALSVYGENIPLTVFGLCMKISMLFFSIVVGISGGARPILGFNYGAEKYNRVKKTLKLSIIVSTIIMTLAWAVYMLFPLQLIRLYGTESALYEQFAVKCFRIYLLTSFLGGIQPCVGSLFQSMGKPGLATLISVNKQVIFYVPPLIILPIFFGVEGLLWAGPIAEILSCAVALFLLKRELKRIPAAKDEEKTEEEKSIDKSQE